LRNRKDDSYPTRFNELITWQLSTRFTIVGFNNLAGNIGAEFLVAIFLAIEDQAHFCSWSSLTERFS
jgi:hypothetical protein